MKYTNQQVLKCRHTTKQQFNISSGACPMLPRLFDDSSADCSVQVASNSLNSLNQNELNSKSANPTQEVRIRFPRMSNARHLHIICISPLIDNENGG